jgi:hypothetical protein
VAWGVFSPNKIARNRDYWLREVLSPCYNCDAFVYGCYPPVLVAVIRTKTKRGLSVVKKVSEISFLDRFLHNKLGGRCFSYEAIEKFTYIVGKLYGTHSFADSM